MTNNNGITISGRLVERLLLGILVLAIGGNSIVNTVKTSDTVTDKTFCDFEADLKRNLQLFLDDHIALHEHVDLTTRGTNIAQIQDSIDRLRTPSNC